MYIHPDRRLVYLAHPKTASMSVAKSLATYGFVRAASRPDLEPTLCQSPTISAHHRPLAKHPGNGWRVFTTVRNHFDAWASWWSFRSAKTKQDFDPSFIESMVETSPEYWPVPNRMWALHTAYADFVLRFERQEEDLRELLRERDLVLGYENVSEKRAGRSYQSLISLRLRSFIESKYGLEMDGLDYTWGSE